MELQPNLVINKDFYELAIIAQDNHVTVINNRQTVMETNFTQIDAFIRDEMVPVIEYNTLMGYEIRNEKNESVLPLKIQAKTLWLCPFFFGKRWSLWSGKTFICDLNTPLYLKLRGWNPEVH